MEPAQLEAAQREVDAICTDEPTSLLTALYSMSNDSAHELLQEAMGELPCAKSDIRPVLRDLAEQFEAYPAYPSALFQKKAADLVWDACKYMQESLR